VSEAPSARAPVTPALTGGFFVLASVITLAAGASLLAPGRGLDWMWAAKPAGHAQLLAMEPWAGLGFLGFSAVAVATSAGCFQRRRWAWRLAIAVFLVNGLSDAARIPFGAVGEGVLGVVATSLIVWGLTRPRVRALFSL
jgi:hypothetical protein